MDNLDVITEHYPSGRIWQQYSIKNNVKCGNYIQYHDFPKNMIHIQCFYNEKGQKNGSYSVYYVGDSSICELKCTYVDDRLEGLLYAYDVHGRIVEKTNYANNKRNGTREVYLYTDGNEHYDDMYYDYEKNPVSQTPYEITEIHHIDGMKQGECVKYNSKYEVTHKCIYVDDKRNGLSVHYFPDGKIESQCMYIDGKREGEAIWYLEDGTIHAKHIFVNDKIIDPSPHEITDVNGNKISITYF